MGGKVVIMLTKIMPDRRIKGLTDDLWPRKPKSRDHALHR